MLPSLDPKIKRFYLEMGFNEKQIQRAHEYCQRNGADMLDALNMPAPIQAPSKQTNHSQQQLPAPKIISFLTPWNKTKAAEYQVMFSRSNKQMQAGSRVQLREADYPVGLLNVSNCCYLNSLLQCYFLMDKFKTAILTAEPLPAFQEVLASQSKTKVKRIRSEYELLAKLRWFFTKMSLTSRRYLDPTPVLHNLVDSVGEKVSYGQQKDLSQINILIIQRLSEGLTYSKNHYQKPQQDELLDIDFGEQKGSVIMEGTVKRPYNSIFNPKDGAIKKLFYGSRVEYYVSKAMQKQAPIVSDFAGLILNPRAGSLYRALDEQFNFQVQLNGGVHKKVAFIRDEPQYLFLYINRTEFDREEGQALKNQQKFAFDFVLYLDRYLEKYKEEGGVANERIRQLLGVKSRLQAQRNSLHLLLKKVEECQVYAAELQGWSQRLPAEQAFQEQFKRLQQRLRQVQAQLDKIESRREQYHLMYIFVHRGDAVSGHYWGYGRNAGNWYRFDINTKKVLQEQIIIDLEKSAATPYALLYVKEGNLPRFDYPIHTGPFTPQSYPAGDFRRNLDIVLAGQVSTENKQLQLELLVRNNQLVRTRTGTEYVGRYNAVKKVGHRYAQLRQRLLSKVGICNNFSLFLWSREQYELSKFTLFEQALLSASGGKVTIQRLLHEADLLPKIQRKFKRFCRGELHLKSYALMPKQEEKYAILFQEYQLSAFEVIWGCVILKEAQQLEVEWTEECNKHMGVVFTLQPRIKNKIIRLLVLMKVRAGLIRSEQYRKANQTLTEPLYISQINGQVTRLALFRIMTTGVKVSSLQTFVSLQDAFGSQLAMINAGNSIELDQKGLLEKGQAVETAVELINQFNENRNNSNQRGSIKGQEKRSSARSQSQCLSPTKSNARQSLLKDKRGLIVCPKSVLVLQGRQCWKLQELQNIRINYDFGQRLLSFLKKLGVLPRVYKHIIQLGRGLSLQQLQEAGVFVNLKKTLAVQSQSLI